ncbi:hypothetical protein DWUX_402 [Desulfovibrio diazotrophicus]|nr:hypothetical protein DWUX_402 [Desulfovibrio diazotrophicus]
MLPPLWRQDYAAATRCGRSTPVARPFFSKGPAAAGQS